MMDRRLVPAAPLMAVLLLAACTGATPDQNAPPPSPTAAPPSSQTAAPPSSSATEPQASRSAAPHTATAGEPPPPDAATGTATRPDTQPATEPVLGPDGEEMVQLPALPGFIPAPLAPGERPPQFVVVSFDGAGEDGLGLYTHYRELSQELGGSMTFFLSSIYAIPEEHRDAYRPPRHAAGASAIGFLGHDEAWRTLASTELAHREGHEIGTHFGGHWCGADGVRSWSPADWDQEIRTSLHLVQDAPEITADPAWPQLSFDYAGELQGSRTPCLEGRDALLQAPLTQGWRYDSSGVGRQVWPRRAEGSQLWWIPLGSVPFGPEATEVVSMDYNFMYQQSGDSTQGDPAHHPAWEREVTDALLAGFTRAYDGNRAPLVLGNHFEAWNGGVYLDGLDTALREMATRPDVRFVSFSQLVAWLDVQPPEVLTALQGLDVGQAPVGGWRTASGGNS